MTVLTKSVIIGGVTLILLVLIMFGLAYQHRSAERAFTEAATQQNLRTITAVEIQYYNSHSQTFGTFEQMVKEGWLNRSSGETPIIDDYTFTLKITSKATNQISSYTLNADPHLATWPRMKHFYIDSTSPTIRVNSDRPAGANDPPLGD
jgi:hypothetical protein